MLGMTFIEQLKRSWKTMLIVGGVMAFFGLLMSSFVQDMDLINQYSELLGQFPSAVTSALGIEELETVATPEGFIAYGYFLYGIFIVSGYAVVAGLNVIANDEDDGIMNVVLALPIPRWQVIIEKIAAYALIMTGVALIGYMGIFIGTSFQPEEIDVNLMRLFIASMNLVPSALIVIALTTFVASIFPRKGIVSGVATAFVIVSYFIFMMKGAADHIVTDTLGRFSYYTYFDAQSVVANGLPVMNVVILLAVSVILVGISLVSFERRDIA